MRIHIPTNDNEFGYKSCYACGTITSGSWHANRHPKQKQIILHHLCQHCYDHFIWYPQRYDPLRKEFEEQPEMVQCACGCGKEMPRYNRFGVEKKYYWSSHATFDIKASMFKKRVFIQCRCGCGEFTEHYPERGSRRSWYINGHHARVLKEEGNRIVNLKCQDVSDQRRNVLKLYGYMKKNGCIVNDDICKKSGHLYLVPLDGNHYNTDIENYVVLCNSHKLLKSFRKLTSLAEILAIKHTFYEKGYGTGGRRRWFKAPEIPGIEMAKIPDKQGR